MINIPLYKQVFAIMLIIRPSNQPPSLPHIVPRSPSVLMMDMNVMNRWWDMYVMTGVTQHHHTPAYTTQGIDLYELHDLNQHVLITRR